MRTLTLLLTMTLASAGCAHRAELRQARRPSRGSATDQAVGGTAANNQAATGAATTADGAFGQPIAAEGFTAAKPGAYVRAARSSATTPRFFVPPPMVTAALYAGCCAERSSSDESNFLPDEDRDTDKRAPRG